MNGSMVVSRDPDMVGRRSSRAGHQHWAVLIVAINVFAVASQIAVTVVRAWQLLLICPILATLVWFGLRALRRTDLHVSADRDDRLADPLDALTAAARSLVVRARLPVSLLWLLVLALPIVTGEDYGFRRVVAYVFAIGNVVLAATAAALAVRTSKWTQIVAASRTRQLSEHDAELDLTLVVPYYNAGKLLRKNLDRLIEVLDRTGASFEIIPVSDGSTDGSAESIADYPDPRVIGLVHEVNQGKGAALHTGFTMGRGRYLGFIDADGDLDPELLGPYLELIGIYDPDIVMGSKRHPLSEIVYPPLRQFYSIGYQIMTRILFSLNTRDTQTGLKLMRRDVLAEVLPRMLEKRFAFDLEFLVVSRHLGFTRVIEAPVILHEQLTSTISLRSVWDTLLDTFAIYYRAEILRYYDSPAPQPELVAAAQPAALLATNDPASGTVA